MGRRTVAPVVVKPEIDSKSAWSTDVSLPVAKYGMAPTQASETHASVTVTKTSRFRTSVGTLVPRHTTTPIAVVGRPQRRRARAS